MEKETMTVGRKLAWWILSPIVGMLSGILIGELIVIVIGLLSSPGDSIGGIVMLSFIGFVLGGWFLGMAGFALGIAIAIKKTTNLID